MAFCVCSPARVRTTSSRTSHGPVRSSATARPIAEVLEPKVDAE
jgi:hypothetical protein